MTMTATKHSGEFPERHKAHLSWPPNLVTSDVMIIETVCLAV